MSAGEPRILHVITRLDRGGSATNTLLTVAGLARPFRPTLVFGRTAELPPLARQVAERVETVELPVLVRNPSPVHDLRALVALYRLMRQGAFDLVHTHTSKAGVLGRAAARLAGVRRIVHTPHGHYFHGGYAGPAMIRLFVRLERWAARFTDRLVALTDQEARDHLRLGIGTPAQFATIPSGVELAAFEKPAEPPATVRAALGLPPHAGLIGSVGRLEPVKGHRYLVDAFARLAPRFPELHLALIGDGPLFAELRARAQRQGVAERVRFLGWRDDTPVLLHALDLFVFPSLNEGMGRALVEAMAAGRPIVASRAGGIPEVLAEGEAGLLVEPADALDLARGIETLLRDPGLRTGLGEAGRRRAHHYGLDVMGERLAALYRELLGGP